MAALSFGQPWDPSHLVDVAAPSRFAVGEAGGLVKREVVAVFGGGAGAEDAAFVHGDR